jgi:deoxycytidylate deaminase
MEGRRCFSARHGAMTNYAILYTTLRPCLDCFRLAIQAGVREIVYDRPQDFSQQLEEIDQTLIIETSIIVRQHPYTTPL